MTKNHPQAMGGGGADGGRGTLINFLRNKVSARRPQAPQAAAPTAPQGYQPMAGDGRQAMLQAMLMRARGGATPQPAQPAMPPVPTGTGY